MPKYLVGYYYAKPKSTAAPLTLALRVLDMQVLDSILNIPEYAFTWF